MELNDTVLPLDLIGKLMNTLPQADILDRLRDCSESEIQNMPEGEQVQNFIYLILYCIMNFSFSHFC